MPLTFAETPLYYKDSQGQYHRVLSGADMTGYRTAAAQDAIDANLMALGLTGASVGDLVRVNAVDANGRPTSWKRVALNEIKCNKNLLDNWYFVGGGSQLGDGAFPINQRGQTAYISGGYTIDRWIQYVTVNLVLESDGFRLGAIGNGCFLCNKLPGSLANDILGKIVTLSVLFENDGQKYLNYKSMTIPSSLPTSEIKIDAVDIDSNFTLSLQANSDTIFPMFFCETGVTANSHLIKAVKLELGSEQTLAHNEGTEESPVWVLNEIPDYGEELAKCQRYCIKLNRLNTIWQWVGNAIGWSTTEIDCFIPTPVTMIRNPSALDISEWMITDGLSYITPSNLALYASSGGIKAVATVTGATQGKAYFVGASNSGESLLVSADL